MTFNYADFTTRNLGFVTPEEQERLREATVFVCGTGGMGGAAILALVRAGIGRLMLADIDEFEVSNLNRQVFCTLASVGSHKAEATSAACLQINPDIKIEVFRNEWPEHVDNLVGGSTVVINGTDDLAASLLLYRTARTVGKAVIDAYASPLPSVYVTRSNDPMPEERLGYPTLGTPWDQISEQQRADSFLREAEYVILNSSSRHHVDLELAGQVAAGTRSRMSFAPMVISTGMLMAYETIALILERESPTDAAGWFFNPYKPAIEKPRNRVATALMRPFVTRFLAKMMASGT
ncbi:ThiF family adenylyltransferase [uncultured Roseibium sp.]|uniref:HesA/MoeB/ThiF family protein n=1 Tax=uncultured Roseibium sp. TaxID=1936171 RepID=UPI0026237EE1|nr:ThiF family adenylyltransferase [uncultured Roseibium sp.]